MTRHRKQALLVAIPALAVLLGITAILDLTVRTAARRAAGLMPEIVCTADRSFNIVDEIVVRAARPLSAVAVARLSGINK